MVFGYKATAPSARFHGSRLRNDFIENSRHVLTGGRIPSARQVADGQYCFFDRLFNRKATNLS
jgi:hypothetical protein